MTKKEPRSLDRPAGGDLAREADLRRQRLAEALRENLKRRKAQARSRQDSDEA